MRNIILLLFVIVCSFNSSSQLNCGEDNDLNTWVREGPSSYGTWNVSPDGRTVEQTINGEPTFFVSPDTFINVIIEGKIKVDTINDDDLIGFVFGYNNPSGVVDSSNMYVDSYVFDWKQGTQTDAGGTCNEGYALYKVDGVIDYTNYATNYGPVFWQRVTNPISTLMATNYGANGWNDYQEYTFRLSYTAWNITVWVDGVEIVNVDGCYEPGRFGFYNFSQNYVKYSDFSYQYITDFEIGNPHICADDTAVFTLGNTTCPYSNYYPNGTTFTWDFGDGDTAVGQSQNHPYSAGGDYDVKLTYSDASGCTDSVIHAIKVNEVIPNALDTISRCDGNTVTIDASFAGAGSYNWNVGGTTSSITVDSSKLYIAQLTDTIGCLGLDSTEVVIFDNPIVDLGNDTAICVDSTVTFDAVVGVSWLWNTGANTKSISVNTAGTYSVIVTDVNGCLGYDTVSLSVNALPVIDLGNDTAICIDSAIVFDALTGTNWVWSNGAITQSVSLNTSGTYDVIVTDVNGCVGYDTVGLSINALPIVNLGNDTSICADSTIVLDAVTGVSWVWNNGDLTQATTVNTTGVYDVVATDINGCVGYDTISLGINSLPVISLGNDTSICADSSLVVDALVGTSWAWSNGDVTQSTTINTSGIYDVVVTDANGCVGYDTIALGINALPVVNLGNDTAICSDSTIVFDALVGSSWIWNNGDLTQTSTVNTSGDYDVVVTDANGCVGYDTINLSINNVPIVDLGEDTSACADSAIVFDAVVGANWLWSNGDVTQTTTVNATGNYSVIVTDVNGCVGYDTVLLSIDSFLVVNLGNDVSICTDSIMEFDAVIGSSWLWSNGATTKTISTNTAGTYDVVVTDADGCMGHDTVVLSLNSLPIVDLGNDTSICSDSSMVFDAVVGAGWLWNTGEVAQSITVDSSGVYDVRVQDVNGCVGYDTIVLNLHSLPVVNIGNDTAICIDSVVTFEATIGAEWLWSNGDTTQSITVNSTGDYDVVVIDVNGCVGYDTIALTLNALPVINLGNDTSICADSTLALNVSKGQSWLWNTGAITNTIIVDSTGLYSVMVVDSNGCAGYDSLQLTINSLPIVSLGNDTSICADGNISFDAVVGNSWEWNNGSTTKTITIDSASEYSVIVTNLVGCVGYDTVSLIINELPDVQLGNDTSICTISTITFDAGDAVSYSWFPNGEISQSITVNTAGDYSVVVVDTNGCVGRDTVGLVLTLTPDFSLGVDTSICTGDSISFNPGSGFTYLWMPGGETQQVLTADTAGAYSVTITDAAGCAGSDTILLFLDSIPVVDLGSDTSTCIDSLLVLNAQNNGGSYSWNTGATSKQLTVNASGVYKVDVTSSKGCVGTDSIELKINELPTPDLGIDSSLCQGDSMELTTGLNNVQIGWNSMLKTTDSIVVNTAGIYIVSVTDSNHCVGYDTVIVSVDAIPVVDLGPDSSLCFGDEMVINAGNGGNAFNWSNGAKTKSITIDSASNYVVEVINSANCSTMDTIVVTVDTLPVFSLGADTTICDLDSVKLSIDPTGVSYSWSTGDTASSIQIKNKGRYIATVTSSYNCVAKDTLNLNVNELPDVDLGADRDVCLYKAIDLSVGEKNALSYNWSSGETTNEIWVNTPGQYYIDVIDTNNCFKSDTIQIIPGPELTLDFTADSVICFGTQTDISVIVSNETGGVNYKWSTLETISEITVDTTGVFKLLVIDGKGCWGEGEQSVRVQSLPSIKLISDTNSMCSMPEAEESTVIKAEHNGAYVEWTTSGGVGNELFAEESGFFEALVYDNFGCSAYDSVTISEFCRPIDITIPNIFTPNGDGINDCLIPLESVVEKLAYLMIHIEDINFKVYNRWGNLVHLSSAMLPRWDGLDNSGNTVPDGTYFWVLEYRNVDGTHHMDNGYVKLQR